MRKVVEKREIYFSPGGENRRLHLYLPQGYEEGRERLPVLYMFDGHNLFSDRDATYGKSLGLGDFLDAWCKRMIVVGIECSMDDYTRVHEYCPFDIHSGIYGDIAGRGEETMRFIVEELKPFIDSRYPTFPFREATAIAGYSMGGMLALYGVLRHNRYFSKAAVISPSVLPAMDAFRREIDRDALSADTRVFMSWGTNEYGPMDAQIERSLFELERRMQQKGASTYMYRHEGGQHNEASWEKQLPVWMRFLWF
ncbi:MAG: alpha/beta hydrolase-fold protein [Clostridia bacterium]|nr:alpha/beta hydrolase-fold protein [Clostridia bacterium]